MFFKDLSYEYVVVDDFLKSPLLVSSLLSFFDLKLVNYIKKNESCTLEELLLKFEIKEYSLKILFEVLKLYDVFDFCENRINFSNKFKVALKYEDLLLAKLRYSKLIYYDMVRNFKQFVVRDDFDISKNKLFKLFWLDETKWIEFIGVLTKYDSVGILKNFNFSNINRVLELGGNCGELALNIVSHYSHIKYEIIDLYSVCSYGEKRVNSFDKQNNISFQKKNFFQDDWENDFDLVILKSVLHDHSFDKVQFLLEKIFNKFKEGQQILIYEYGEKKISNETVLNKYLFTYNFWKCFRTPDYYINMLKKIGFKNLNLIKIEENGFFLITGKK